MPDAHAADFVRALAGAVLRQEPPGEAALRARAALDGVFAGHRSLVLEVQFTGFTWRGRLLGGVDPVLLRAAGQLIMLRVARLGFTPEAGVNDLDAVFEILARSPGKVREGGVTAALQAAAPAGVYASTATGEVYRPPAAVPPAVAAPAADEPASDAKAAGEPPAVVDAASPLEDRPAPSHPEEVEATELDAFELVDPVEVPAARSASAPAPAASEAEGSEAPPDNDLFHFFRATPRPGGAEAAESLPQALRDCENMSRFDELAQAAAASVLDLVQEDRPGEAVALLDALVTEAQRPDRNRFFRETAVQALRRTARTRVLHALTDHMSAVPADRDRILRYFAFAGSDAMTLLRGVLFRAADPDLRIAVLRALLSVEGEAGRLLEQAAEDPGPVRMRQLLELGRLPEVQDETALAWATKAAAHPDASVRVDAVALAAGTGGRGATRILVELLRDRERLVRKQAVAALGNLREPGATPFLARFLADASDEEMELAAITALGRTGSSDAVAPLAGVLGRRQLFGKGKTGRLKSAALQALGRIGTPAAREALAAAADGRDDLAPEARRILRALS
jgi:HEAT repeat protein